MLLEEPGVLVAQEHHLLVRWSHWFECADPSRPHSQRHLHLLGFRQIYRHKPDPITGNFDVAADNWNLDMHPCARTALLQQSAPTGFTTT